MSSATRFPLDGAAGVAHEHRNKSRRRSLASLLKSRCSNPSIPAGGQLRRTCCVCCGAQDVFDLVRSCERVQVGRGRGMARSAGRVLSGFGRRFLRSLVRGQRASSL
jgi:hypothetical protein